MLQVRFSRMDMGELADVLTRAPVPPGTGARSVVTANLDHVVQLGRNPAFRAAYDRAWVATADGAPVFWYARLRGAELPERVTGADLFAVLMERLSPESHRVFFVANSAATAGLLADKLIGRGFSAGSVTSEVPPFGFEHDAEYGRQLAERVRRHGTTHLIMGVGAPKSEIWADQHQQALGDCYVLAVGAALDFVAGVRRRAPKWVQRYGLEWAWRLGSEPRRLARRYLLDSWGFLGAVRDDLSGGR